MKHVKQNKILLFFILVFALIFPQKIILANTNIDLSYENIEWKNLLHYKNNKSHIYKKSSFFTSPKGYKNPQAEYLEILNLLEEKEDIQCIFPARTIFILEQENLEEIDFSKCNDFLEYQEKVPIDFVEIAFACEDNANPASMLGHSFLILTGNINGQERKHIVEYATSIRNLNFLELTTKGIIGKLKGIYNLYPYEKYKNKYLTENRSIWKFKLNLNNEEREKLKKHIWEIKDKESYYSITSHNCNSALVDLLKVADNSFNYQKDFLFTTPLEYLQFLQEENKISDISLDLSKNAFEKIEKYGLKNILNAPKPTKIDLSYFYSNKISGINFTFIPLYQDIYDISDAYNDIRETEILTLSGNYYFNNKFSLQNMNIIKTRSLLDISTNKTFSKYFKLSVENLPDSYNNLYPNIEYGLGTSKYYKNFKIYLMPFLGYRYKNGNILYFVSEIGVISDLTNRSKFILSYMPEFDILNDKSNLSKLTGYFGYKLSDNYSIFINALYYPKSEYKRFSVGVRKYF